MERDTSYIKVDETKYINENCIMWIKQMGDCLQICTIPGGCIFSNDLHIVCKRDYPKSFDKLNRLIGKLD